MSRHLFFADKTAEVLGLTLAGEYPKVVPRIESSWKLVIWYGGWSPKDLEASPKLRDAYRAPAGFSFYRTVAERGYYAVRTSELEKSRTWDKQIGAPRSPFALCPAVIGITAALLLLMDTEDSFLGGKSGACAEDLGNGGHRPVLYILNGMLMTKMTSRVDWDGTTFPMLQRIECKKIG